MLDAIITGRLHTECMDWTMMINTIQLADFLGMMRFQQELTTELIEATRAQYATMSTDDRGVLYNFATEYQCWDLVAFLAEQNQHEQKRVREDGVRDASLLEPAIKRTRVEPATEAPAPAVAPAGMEVAESSSSDSEEEEEEEEGADAPAAPVHVPAPLPVNVLYADPLPPPNAFGALDDLGDLWG